jgi:hypothetical protein
MDASAAAGEKAPGRGPAWPFVALAAWVLAADAWFQGPLLGGRVPPAAGAWLLAVLALAVLALATRERGVRHAAPRSRSFLWAVAGMLLLATLVRLPALRAPGSLISSDSAVAGIIAQELRSGEARPPIYAPGFPYEGTLKPHLTALLGAVVRPASTPALYTWTSHLFFLLWIAAVMVLAGALGGTPAALCAGAFLAVSPRFLAAFSLNNVGQYPEVNAMGALALALLAAGGGPLAAAFVAGLALWQQLVAVSFLAVVGAAILATPDWRRPAHLARALAGFAAGTYPIWIWNAAHGWATFDFFRRGGKDPLERLAGVPERLERTIGVSFPKLFGLSDLDLSGPLAAGFGLVLPALVLLMAWARRHEIARDRGRSAALLGALLFAVTLSVFVVSKFSHRGVQRPRYLIPLYTPVALAVGWSAAALARRSPASAAAAMAVLLGANVAGLVPWLRARADAEARDEAFLGRLAELGVHTGYSGFWLGPKYSFLSEGRVVLSGELGPVVSWVHPPHAARVAEEGPDALVVPRGALADALAARLDALSVSHRREDVTGQTVFSGFSRRVTLEEVAGYDEGVTSGVAPEAGVGEESDTTS